MERSRLYLKRDHTRQNEGRTVHLCSFLRCIRFGMTAYEVVGDGCWIDSYITQSAVLLEGEILIQGWHKVIVT